MATANAISLNINLIVTNGLYSRTWSENDLYTQNAQGECSGVASTSTTPANLDVGSVTTLGYVMLKNLDSTNNVDVGIVVSAAFQAFATLKPGEVGCFRLKAGVTVQLKAAAGTPLVQYWLLQD